MAIPLKQAAKEIAEKQAGKGKFTSLPRCSHCDTYHNPVSDKVNGCPIIERVYTPGTKTEPFPFDAPPEKPWDRPIGSAAPPKRPWLTAQDCNSFTSSGSDEEKKAIAESPYRERLLRMHAMLCNKGRDLMIKKNQDYGANDDPFRNFRAFEEIGILVRISDKMARLRTYAERGTLKVEDESVQDTAIDAINYLVLFLAMLEFGEECK